MESKFKGKLIELKPQETKGKFTFQEAIFEESFKDFSQSHSIKLFKDALGKLSNSNIGQMFEVDIQIKSREYNGRYYSDLLSKKITPDIPF